MDNAEKREKQIKLHELLSEIAKQREPYRLLSKSYPYHSLKYLLRYNAAFFLSNLISLLSLILIPFGGVSSGYGIAFLTIAYICMRVSPKNLGSALACRFRKKEKINKIYSELEDLVSTPYYSHIREAIWKVLSPKEFYQVFTDKEAIEKVKEKTKEENWDLPGILSVFDLKTKEEIELTDFNYQNEANNVIKHFLKENPGVLETSPNKIYRQIKNTETPKQSLELLVQNMKESSEKERVKALIELGDYLDDEHFLAKYISMDNKVVAKIWGRDPRKDMGTGEEFYCCTMPTYGPNYILDPNISMLDFYRGGERKARAILAATRNKNNEKCLLVDSIEGTDRLLSNFREPLSRFIINSIKQYGYKSGFDYIQFSKRTMSAVYKKILPSLFSSYPVSGSRLKPMFGDGKIQGLFYLESFRTLGNSILKSFELHRLFGYKVEGPRIELR